MKKDLFMAPCGAIGIIVNDHALIAYGECVEGCTETCICLDECTSAELVCGLEDAEEKADRS